MNCPKCNFQVNDDQKFCPECGTALIVNPTQADVESVPEETPESKPTKKKKLLKWILIGAGVLAVAIACVVLYFTTCIFGHVFQRKYDVPPTCSEDGYCFYDCAKCAAWEKETLAGDEWKAGHKWQAATCASPKTCSACGATEGEALPHSLSNGLCINCNYIAPDLLENFSDVVDAVVGVYWFRSYEKVPKAEDITAEFDKVEFNNGKYYTEGFVFVNEDDVTYGATFKNTHKWSDEHQQYVRDTSELEKFFEVRADRTKVNYTFTNNPNFVHHRSGMGMAKSVLSFNPDGTMTQYIYNYAGTMIGNSPATYNMYKGPGYYEIVLTAKSNGYVSRMIHMNTSSGSGIVWDNDTYILE